MRFYLVLKLITSHICGLSRCVLYYKRYNPTDFVTCCQRTAYYSDFDGTFGRYEDANGYALIIGGSSTVECYGTGNSCGDADVQCDNSSMGFNSLQ